jgi:hypothetical protein
MFGVRIPFRDGKHRRVVSCWAPFLSFSLSFGHVKVWLREELSTR